MKVLFIGATGLVGSHVIPFIKDKFDLSLAALNNGTIEGLDVTATDICDWEATEAFLKKGTSDGDKFDAVVYCATANYREYDRKDPEDCRLYYENCIDVNMRGAYHVFEASWRAEIPKVVHIGSATSMMGYPKVDNIGVEVVNQARDLYAASKIFGELVGRSYVFRPVETKRYPMGETHKMQVLCLRLGQPFISKEEWHQSSYRRSRIPVYVEDIANAITCALHSEVQYGVYPIVSAVANPWVLPEAYAELEYSPIWKFTESDLVKNIDFPTA